MMPLAMMPLVLTGYRIAPANQRALLPLSFRLPLLLPPTPLGFNRHKVVVVGTISLLLRAKADASQPASEAEVRALATTLKKGKFRRERTHGDGRRWCERHRCERRR